MNGTNNTNSQAPVKDPGETLGFIGLLLSLVSFFLSASFVLPLAGIICSYIARKLSIENGFTNKKANIGLIAGMISLALGILTYVLFILLTIGVMIFCFVAFLLTSLAMFASPALFYI